MIARILYATVVVIILLTTATTSPTQTTEEIAENALAATVYLEMQDRNGLTLGIGSGFFVRPDLIATNFHVIQGAAQGTAKLVGKRTTYIIEGITATDKDNDLVLLKVITHGIKSLSLGDSDTVRIGTPVYVVGNPKGMEGTFSDGIISSIRGTEAQPRFQMTAPISSGSSGGPVLNRKGEVIGVSASVHQAADAQNINFAIPVNKLKGLLTRAEIVKPLTQGSKSISAKTYFNQGNKKLDLGDYASAITDYTQAIHLKSNFALAYYNRGIAKATLKQHSAAIVDYDIAIRLDPDDASAYYNRGVSKANLEKYKTAIADFDIAISLKPDHAKAYHSRGLMKALLGRTSEAKQDYQTALKLAKEAGNESLIVTIKRLLKDSN